MNQLHNFCPEDDQEDIKQADQVMLRIENNIETLHSLEEVEQESGMAS